MLYLFVKTQSLKIINLNQIFGQKLENGIKKVGKYQCMVSTTFTKLKQKIEIIVTSLTKKKTKVIFNSVYFVIKFQGYCYLVIISRFFSILDGLSYW